MNKKQINSLLKVSTAATLGLGAYSILDKKYALSNDLKFIATSLPMLMETSRVPESYTIADIWESVCDKHLFKTALIFTENGNVLSFKEVDESANRIANHYLNLIADKRLESGDSVGLMMENRPQYIITLLGLTKAGLVPALINTNNKDTALVHSIKVSSCKSFIFGSEVNENVLNIQDQLCIPKSLIYSVQDNELNATICQDLIKVVEKNSAVRPTSSARSEINLDSVYGYIYTSGTTGLPKACKLKHRKLILVSNFTKHMYGLTDHDIHYCPLPLYHTAGGILGLTRMVCSGNTLVLARKFSATKFFQECKRYNCTTTQYIGETARYLLNSTPSKEDTLHSVRLMFGNGLRREIWLEFLTRFNIRQVGEFYGSTEGNASICQLYTKDKSPVEAIGSVGCAGVLLKKAMNLAVVKFDIENEIPKRNENGFCVPADVNEPGELLGLISKAGSKEVQYDAYVSEEANEKKILRNVFSTGDSYFRTGDLLRQNSKGWLYFVDRVGDTFRWKGENVSTNEVSEAVSTYDEVLEANVYGVKVPKTDGRACMASIILKDGEVLEEFNLSNFWSHCSKRLASYAMPKFLRFQQVMEATGTFKQRKGDLVKEGFDLSKVKDPLFIENKQTKTYNLLTEDKYVSLSNGLSRL